MDSRAASERGVPGGPWTFAAGLLALAAAALAAWAGLATPDPLPADAPEGGFSAGRAGALLRGMYSDLASHPVGSEENRILRGRIEDRLREMGYEPEVQRQVACRSPRAVCAIVENVLARIEGAPGRKAILVSSHYDSVPAGPSVSDAGASVAAILEIARALRQDGGLANPVVFLINDGEEAGLLGARAFLEGHRWAREVGAVVNLEARGTSGRSWMFETSAGGAWLVRAYARSVPHPATASVAYAIYKRLPTDTDLTVYKAAGLQGVGLAFIERIQHYHTSADSLAHLDEESLQQQGETALALVRELGSMDLTDPPRGEAVFFDLLGLATIWWPASWGLPLAVAAAALATLAALVLMRAGMASPREVVLGVGAWVGTAAAAAAGGFGAALLLDGLGAFRNAYPAHAWAHVGAACAAGTAAAFAVTAWLAGRAGAWGLHSGGAIAWALLNAALTALDPALSYLALIPAVSLGGAALAAGVIPSAPVRAAALVLAPVPGALVWSPLIFVLFGAMGEVVLPAIAILAALAAAQAMPALGALGRRVRLPAYAAGTCFALLAAVAAVAPDATEALPERLSLGYNLDRDEGMARWVLYAKEPLPAPLLGAAGGTVTRDRALPWWDWDEILAPAPAVDLPAPEATIVSASGELESAGTGDRGEPGAPAPVATPEAGADGPDDPLATDSTTGGGAMSAAARDAGRAAGGAGPSVVRLRSARGATYLELILPREARVTRVHYPRTGASEVGEGAPSGEWRAFRFLGVPPEGLEIEVTLEAEEPVEGWIMDRTGGLPAEGKALVEARPGAHVPSQVGDSTVVYRKITVPRR